MDSIFKILLLPFSLIYGIAISFRNLCYDLGIFKSQEYPFPVICIGNLSVGGTGKTPHSEFIIKLLKNKHRVASLSRGYGRKTKGYKLANTSDNAKSIGDESFQIFKKFPSISVAVAEKRRKGIEKLLQLEEKPEIIVMDDAYQHRAVKAGMNILLTDYSKLYIDDVILPSGRLREWKSGAKRADLIVITKSPAILSPLEIRRISQSLKPRPYQKVFFSYISYKKAKALNQVAIEIAETKDKFASKGVLIVSAIANPESLVLHMSRYSREVQSLSFRDHHYFDAKDYKKINSSLKNLLSSQKAIIITEKDAVKFDATQFGNIPVFCVPISIKFHLHQEQSFTEEIENYVRSYTKGS